MSDRIGSRRLTLFPSALGVPAHASSRPELRYLRALWATSLVTNDFLRVMQYKDDGTSSTNSHIIDPSSCFRPTYPFDDVSRILSGAETHLAPATHCLSRPCLFPRASSSTKQTSFFPCRSFFFQDPILPLSFVKKPFVARYYLRTQSTYSLVRPSLNRLGNLSALAHSPS